MLNKTTNELAPYPMEELRRIKGELVDRGQPIFDFGTGDPKIPIWGPIREALIEAVSDISQYPSVAGTERLKLAQQGYLRRRFGLTTDNNFAVIPSAGSKEAIFHVALCIVGRQGGRKHILYPDPGYPVYRASALFAGGIPYPVRVLPENNFLLEPWDLPAYVQKDAAALWINYPHNPTGALAPPSYLERLVDWAEQTDTILLSDDCYVDIYTDDLGESHPSSAATPVPNRNSDDSTTSEANAPVGETSPTIAESTRPTTPLVFKTEGILSFMSLSKRSGMTGYRSGLIAGDPKLIAGLLKARANFGVGSPSFVQNAAAVAWEDDNHVAERRAIFCERLSKASAAFINLGLLQNAPQATFYLWIKVPEHFNNNDIKFCLSLAEQGVIASPSQWLSENVKGYVRFALVPNLNETDEALEIITQFVQKGQPKGGSKSKNTSSQGVNQGTLGLTENSKESLPGDLPEELPSGDNSEE